MTGRYAELLMYTAPHEVEQANEKWLVQILQKLGVTRRSVQDLNLMQLWLAPELLLTQTCGYPLMTKLRGQVKVIGRPRYELPDATGGNHCSLLLAREDNPRVTLPDFLGSRGVLNESGSNTGMNLLRHRVAPYQQNGQFFDHVKYSGSHRQSLRWLREGLADLAAIDSVTFAYLARFSRHEVAGLRIVDRTAESPSLPYISAAGMSEKNVGDLREAMNQALRERPDVATTLGLSEVLPSTEADYQVLLDYRNQAKALGLEHLY
jgi:ABC-type phosphate/phosphonate transport system substrate-binding protein